MRTIYKFLAFCIACLILAAPASAQKKSETKLFNNVIAKGDTISFNKFLKKYPNSVYAGKVKAKKDSLISLYNTTHYTQQQTNSFFSTIAADLLPSIAVAGKDFIAYSQRKNNVEYIVGVIASQNNDNLNIVKYQENNGIWQCIYSKEESRYIQDDNLNKFSFIPSDKENIKFDSSAPYSGTFTEVTVKGEKYLLFNYINYSDGIDPRSQWKNTDIELISNLLSLSGENLFNTMYGGEKVNDSIYGSCSDSAQGGIMSTPQINYLVGYLSGIESLKPSDKERDSIKEAIKWWYKNNSKGKGTLNFGVLEKDHPIIQKFLASKNIERSANNSADFFDIMETTVLCAHNKGTGQYLLVWCEPQSKDPKNDKTLSSLYFEKGNTIVLYYYHGKKTSKERINLGTRQKN